MLRLKGFVRGTSVCVARLTLPIRQRLVRVCRPRQFANSIAHALVATGLAPNGRVPRFAGFAANRSKGFAKLVRKFARRRRAIHAQRWGESGFATRVGHEYPAIDRQFHATGWQWQDCR